jgi:hypothetical protein
MALAFVDDSGSGGDSPYYVLGGYVGHVPEWNSFVTAWQGVLDLTPRLEYFKMSEAESLKGQFLGFSADVRTSRLAEFIDVILQHDLFEWSVAISEADYREVLLPTLLPAFRSPYYFAFIGMVTALSGRYRWSGSDEIVDFVFDEQEGMDRKALGIYQSFKTWFPHWRLGKVAHRSDRDFLPLQAADLISWQTRRFMCSTEGTRAELRRLHSKYPQPPRMRVRRSDLENMARSLQQNLESLVGDFGVDRVEHELGKIHRKNQRQGILSPDFVSSPLRQKGGES